MKYLNPTDYTVIVIYFGILVALGFYLKKRASASIEDYFLAGRKLPWWALGISGMASFLDITGTMVIVSVLYLLGPRGLYIAFRGGAVLALVAMLLWTGKWHRRSGCMTGAEWNIYRFGSGTAAQATRLIGVFGQVLMTVGMIAYMVKGVGLFLSMFLPFTPLTCAIILIGIAAVYTMASGFYGVVFTDMFQSVIILVAVIGISTLAIIKVGNHGSLAVLAQEVTGNSNWLSSVPSWHTEMPKGYESYQYLLLIALFYLFRNMLSGMGGGADPKYFGAKSDRDCGKLTFLWTWLMMFRWPMMIGFAVLGLFLVKDLFPDQTVLLQAADLIKAHVGDINKAQWANTIGEIANRPETFSRDLITGLQGLLGGDWSTKLNMVSFEGTVDPERILPAVILFNIPMGLRGLLLVALIAASMSTFDSTVNTATGFFTRDLYQAFIRPKASTRELIYASWGFIAVLTVLGFLFAFTVKSIHDIYNWIIMGLGGAMMVGGIVRLYWWRFNAGGVLIGAVIGLVGTCAQRIFIPDMHPIWQFVFVVIIGSVGAVVGTFLSKPTEKAVIENFYRTTRPFGFWGKLKPILPEGVRKAMEREHRNDIIAIPFALGWHITLFMLPMQLIVRAYEAFWITLVIFCVCLVGMYFFWYKNLPPEPVEGDEIENTFRPDPTGGAVTE